MQFYIIKTQKRLKLSDILSCFLNFDLAKGGASALSAFSLIAPLYALVKRMIFLLLFVFIINVNYLLLLLSEPAHVHEGCAGSSSRLSRHTSRSATTSNISLG